MTDIILFDLDNTIFDFSRAEHMALAKTLTEIGIEPKKEILDKYSVINLAQWKLLEQKKITRSELKIRRYKLFFEELGVDYPPQEAAKMYEHFLGIGHYYIEGAEKMLEEFSKKYSLYLVTKGITNVQTRRIASAGLEKYFKGIFISEEIGHDKPSREYFEYCFEHMENFTKDRAIIIGDSLSSDILGGINAGIRTVWFNSKGEPKNPEIPADYEITHLDQVKTLLEKI